MQTGIDPMAAAVNAAQQTFSKLAGVPPTASSADSQPLTAPFAQLFTDAVSQASQLEEQAHTAVTGLMSGSGVDVHQAMIATEKASMSFELALAVRNKAVQAYQTVIGMQF
jgi:flagellar hook-basal body complex protein FliE